MKTLIIVCVVICLSCSESPSLPNPEQEKSTKQPQEKNIVLFLGDSLTAGYGLEQQEAYPFLIQEQWKQQKVLYQVQNSGVSGATSADVLKNLDWYLTQQTHTVFIAIGANDGLRGYHVEKIQENIENIVVRCQKMGLRVVLAGIQIPPNYGKEYTEKFAAMYPSIAKKFSLKMMPFLLRDVAGTTKFNQSDGIHPNAEGQKIIAENVLKFFKEEKILP